MKKLALFAILILAAGVTFGQAIRPVVEVKSTAGGLTVDTISKTVKVGGIYNATKPTLTDGEYAPHQLDASGNLKVTGGASSVTAEYISPADFTAAYTSNVTITLTGVPITITHSAQIVYIKKIPATGEAAIYVNGADGVTITHSASVLTIAGAGTPFASGDVYEVGLNGQRKAYDATTRTTKTIEQSPESSRYRVDVIANTTNQSGTTYWPGSSGISMDGFKDLSLSGKIIEGDAVTDSLYVQVSNDATFTDWHTIYGYSPVTNTTTNSAKQVGAGTLTFARQWTDLNFKYVRVVVVMGDATNTLVLRIRRKAL